MEEETIQTQAEVQGTGETSVPVEIPYATVSQLNTVLEGISAGVTPIIVDTTAANTWLCRFEGILEAILLNEHQLAVVQSAVALRDTLAPETESGSETSASDVPEEAHPVEETGEEGADTGESPLTEEEQRLLDETLDGIRREIPENSPTLLVDETTVRFSSAVWYDKIKEQTIMLAGCGGIGSWTGLLLARLQPDRLFLYDPDTVEAVNMAGQLYETVHFGELKVSSLANVMQRFSSFNRVFTVPGRYSLDKGTSNVMICGFDNMEARATFFDAWLYHVDRQPEEQRKECLFLDGRLAAEEFQVLCIRGDDVYNIERYRKEFLFSDAEAEETVCSYKQTSFMANMIASVMVNLFVNFTANLCNPVIPRDLPFLTSYNAELMYFKTEI